MFSILGFVMGYNKLSKAMNFRVMYVATPEAEAALDKLAAEYPFYNWLLNLMTWPTFPKYENGKRRF